MMMRLFRMLLPFLFKVSDRPTKTMEMVDESVRGKISKLEYDDIFHIETKIDKNDKYLYADCKFYAKSNSDTIDKKGLATSSHLRSFANDAMMVLYGVRLIDYTELWREIGSYGEFKREFTKIIKIRDKRIHFKMTFSYV